jgi:predicted nucleic-acid-binding protein
VIGLDTNVIIRYVTQDDARQAALATRLFEQTLTVEDPGFVSLITLCEVCWVLDEAYRVERNRLREVVEGLLGSKQVVVEAPELVWKALRAWQGSAADFSDALIGEIAAANGARHVATFDKAAAKLPTFRLLA